MRAVDVAGHKQDNSIPPEELGRRKFLKRGVAAGLGAAALYVTPSFSSTQAKRAYAGITDSTKPPCADTQKPTIAFSSTLTAAGVTPLRLINNDVSQIFVEGFDNESLENIRVELTHTHGVSIWSDAIDCSDKVTSKKLMKLFLPGLLEEGWFNLRAIVTDCCGNTADETVALQVLHRT